MGTVLDACDGLPVGYWHDAGHGAKLEYCGFLEHEEYLRRYGDRLVGMHVHDTQGARDHRAPGQGGTDFAMLAKYVRPDTILTLELHADVLAGAHHPGRGVAAEPRDGQAGGGGSRGVSPPVRGVG